MTDTAATPVSTEASRNAMPWLLRPLVRETTSGAFIPQLDGLRLFAVIAVVMFHVDNLVISARPHVIGDQLVHRLLSKGYVGVQLFFAISGFVLALPFATAHITGGERICLRRYFARRVTRLEPPYIINLLVMWAAKAAAKGMDLGAQLPHLFASIAYVHYPIYGTASTINAVAWSLEVEIQFYILAPLLTLVFAIRRPALRRGLIVLGILAGGGAQAAIGTLDNHGFTLAHQLHYFLVGFLLVDLYLVEWKEPPTKRAIWDLVGFLAWLAIPIAMLVTPRAAHLIVPAALFAAYGASLRGRLWRAITTSPWIFALGGTCYTIYLYNNQVITTLGRIVNRFIPAKGSYELVVVGFSVVIVPLLLLTTSVLFVLFEKPFMRRQWPTYWWRRLRNRST